MAATAPAHAGRELGHQHPPQQRFRTSLSLWRVLATIAVLAAAGGAIWLAIGARIVSRAGDGTRLELGWPGMQYLIYVVWLVPLVELALLAAGQFNYRRRFQVAPPGKFTAMIIQITTTGREQERVNEIIAQLRGYRLTMPREIWVATEPGQENDYPDADLVLTVPEDFTARSERKARALEYSRRVRARYGLDRPDVKILFNDDDVALTRDYIEKAFAADYDICEGVTSPRIEYAARPFGHFLASHADDLRTHTCLVYCAVFQGILGWPLHVHGEGLTVTGTTERHVTWDWPAFASEDLIFGQQAAKAGLRWGWFHEYAELTSPWTLRDFITQRRRWLWGDIHGIRHREVLSGPAATAVAAKYVISIVTVIFSMAYLYMRVTGELPRSSAAMELAKLSVLAWVGVIFACGWIGAAHWVSAGTDDSRLLGGVLAVLTLPVSALMTVAGVVLPWCKATRTRSRSSARLGGEPGEIDSPAHVRARRGGNDCYCAATSHLAAVQPPRPRVTPSVVSQPHGRHGRLARPPSFGSSALTSTTTSTARPRMSRDRGGGGRVRQERARQRAVGLVPVLHQWLERKHRLRKR